MVNIDEEKETVRCSTAHNNHAYVCVRLIAVYQSLQSAAERAHSIRNELKIWPHIMMLYHGILHAHVIVISPLEPNDWCKRVLTFTCSYAAMFGIQACFYFDKLLTRESIWDCGDFSNQSRSTRLCPVSRFDLYAHLQKSCSSPLTSTTAVYFDQISFFFLPFFPSHWLSFYFCWLVTWLATIFIVVIAACRCWFDFVQTLVEHVRFANVIFFILARYVYVCIQ